MAEQTHGKATVTIEFDARSRSAFNAAVEALHQELLLDFDGVVDGVTVTRHDTVIGEVMRSAVSQDAVSEDVEDAPGRKPGKPGPKRGPKGGGIAAAKAKTAAKVSSGRATKTDDPEAPYGRKADGTPRGKPGRKPASEGSGDTTATSALPRKGAGRTLPSRK
jgi:hypothetical protein